MSSGNCGAVLREAELSDLDQLWALEQRGFTSDRFSKGQYRHLLTKAHAVVFVIQRQEKLIGSATILWRRGSRTARLYSIVIDPDFQGQGLGHDLLEACEAEARAEKCNALSLEVRVDNAKAIAFYERHGFTKRKILPEYYEDGVDGIEMRKPVNDKGRNVLAEGS